MGVRLRLDVDAGLAPPRSAAGGLSAPGPARYRRRMNLLLVMTGGAVGAGARYWTARAALAAFGPGWPWGTWIANLAGGLLMGVLAGVLARVAAGEPWRLLLGVGVLGGYTTFSSFALETVTMIERGAAAAAVGYVLASVLGAVAAVFAGLLLVRVVA